MAESQFAQHAYAGEFHLETRYLRDHWEWEVLRTKNRKRIDGSNGKSLDESKLKAESAARRAGLEGPVIWENIGPELP